MDQSRMVMEDELGELENGQTQNAGPSKRARKNRQSQGTTIQEVFEKMTTQEKAALSAEYREMQVEADDMQANLANTTPAQINAQITRQKKAFASVRDVGIAALDAKLMVTSVDTTMGLARRMQVEGNAFDVDEYLHRIKYILGLDKEMLEDMSEDELDQLEDSLSDGVGAARRANARAGVLGDWEKIGWMAASMYRRVPGVEFMYGPVKSEHRKRTIHRQRQKADIAPETRPQEIEMQKGDKSGPKDETVHSVRLVAKVLDKNDPQRQGLNFFRVVINPDDFGQSVENCFYISFLIKDGRAGVEVADDGEVIVRATDPYDPDNMEQDGEGTKNQVVLELDMHTWQEAIRVFNIEKPMIPHRAYKADLPLAADKWYG